MDKRTEDLLRNFTKNYETEVDPDDDIIWNKEQIFNLELAEMDTFRWFTLFTKSRMGRVGDFTEINAFHSKVLDNCMLFKLEKPIKHLLLLTKESKINEKLKMPFDSIFIDTDLYFPNEKIRVFGLLIHQFFTNHDGLEKDTIPELISELENNKEFSEGKASFEKNKFLKMLKNYREDKLIMCSTIIYSEAIDNFMFVDFNFNIETGKVEKKLELQNKRSNEIKLVEKEISKLVLNLLLFLNEPRVVYYIHCPNNEKRIRKGLIPLPSQIRTKIEIGLSEYIEKIYYHGMSNSKLGYSFWVRGHWRRLVSPRYINKIGQKIWIAPHIVGSGLRPPQIFVLDHSKSK